MWGLRPADHHEDRDRGGHAGHQGAEVGADPTWRPRWPRRWRSCRPIGSRAPRPSPRRSATRRSPLRARLVMGPGVVGGRRAGVFHATSSSVTQRWRGAAWDVAVPAAVATEAAPPAIRRYQVDLPLREQRDGQESRRLVMMPDGRRLVYLAPDGRLWVRALDDLSARPLEGTEGASMPFASPDGNHVGYLRVGQVSLNVVPLDGGPPLHRRRFRFRLLGGDLESRRVHLFRVRRGHRDRHRAGPCHGRSGR
jgi:hypothetical protein